MHFAAMYTLVLLAFPGFTEPALKALTTAGKQAADDVVQ